MVLLLPINNFLEVLGFFMLILRRRRITAAHNDANNNFLELLQILQICSQNIVHLIQLMTLIRQDLSVLRKKKTTV